MSERYSKMRLRVQDEPIEPRRFGSNRADVMRFTGNHSVPGGGSVGTLNTPVELAASVSGFGPAQVADGEAGRIGWVSLNT